MFKLSRRLDYAILAVSHLATRAPTSTVSARALADASHIPPAILANILKELTRNGIVRSARGVHGGYELAVSPDELSIGRLLRALEGEVRLVECVPIGVASLSASGAVGAMNHSGSATTCQIESTCKVKAPLRRVHQRIQEVLDEITFDQLVAEALAGREP
jgi:Rrf2 family protein